jgi:hypothetical protein
MRRNIVIVSAFIGVAALLVWWAVQLPPGVETKSGAKELTAMVSLITAIVSLLTSLVTLITTLVKSRRSGG